MDADRVCGLGFHLGVWGFQSGLGFRVFCNPSCNSAFQGAVLLGEIVKP